jgi:serine protease Do
VVASHDLTNHRTNGVAVQSVAPGGPAAKAGIQAGDVLLKANGRTLRTFLDWEAVKLDLKVGDAIDVTVRSGATTSEHRIVTGDLPTVAASKVRVLRGLDLVTVTPAIRAERHITIESGALVVSIEPEISNQTGIKSGDVIYGINQRVLRTADDVSRELNAIRPGQTFYLYIERGGQRGSLPLRMN